MFETTRSFHKSKVCGCSAGPLPLAGRRRREGVWVCVAQADLGYQFVGSMEQVVKSRYLRMCSVFFAVSSFAYVVASTLSLFS